MAYHFDAQQLLNILAARDTFQSNELTEELAIDHQRLIGAIKSLQVKDGLVNTTEVKIRRIELTEEGEEIIQKGSHEFNVYKIVGEKGITKAEIDVKLKLLFTLKDPFLCQKTPFGPIGLGKALQCGWVGMDTRDGGVPVVMRKVAHAEDGLKAQLQLVKDGKGDQLPQNSVAQLKKRKWITESAIKALSVAKGPNFTTSMQKQELDLTSEMISSGSWRGKQFKQYNFSAMGVPPSAGHHHPLLKVRAEFRDIFFQMGFSEMPTNRFVESSFWNFDGLDEFCTFLERSFKHSSNLSNTRPAILMTHFSFQSRRFPLNSRRSISKSYRYDWKLEEAQKNVLRTHTTAVSARQLYLLAQKPFEPSKMFSIDRVFRNETLDATHLAEFHQVEGVVAERNLSLAHVIGLFTEFFRKCGIENLRFKPTYNPYTEPSMEIYAYHGGLRKWVEIGNSGMFRPEMLLPMGLPEDVSVAGFGLSLERPTMIRYGISNIRELFGHKINLEMVYRNPICRLEQKSD
uniref:phenylalanine--tRNA ligase n=1 Tax=Globodera pallida TaxID=36090 RepID=A0A183BZ40_GLOPA